MSNKSNVGLVPLIVRQHSERLLLSRGFGPAPSDTRRFTFPHLLFRRNEVNRFYTVLLTFKPDSRAVLCNVGVEFLGMRDRLKPVVLNHVRGPAPAIELFDERVVISWSRFPVGCTNDPPFLGISIDHCDAVLEPCLEKWLTLFESLDREQLLLDALTSDTAPFLWHLGSPSTLALSVVYLGWRQGLSGNEMARILSPRVPLLKIDPYTSCSAPDFISLMYSDLQGAAP